MTNQTKNSMLLMLCALIWGTAFVAQSAGSGMGAFSFLAGRSWMAVLVLLPTVKAFDALHHRQGKPDGKPKTAAERKLLLKAGLMCGTLLFLASAAQQLGITLDPSTAKAGCNVPSPGSTSQRLQPLYSGMNSTAVSSTSEIANSGHASL